MTEPAMEDKLRSRSQKAWFIIFAVATLAGAFAAVVYAVTWFPHVASSCGVVRFYEQIFGVLILGAWLVGIAVGMGLAFYGYRKMTNAVIPGSIIAVIVSLGMLFVCTKTIHDIVKANFKIKSTKELIHILENENPNEQIQAAYELGERKTEAAIPYLCALVSDKTLGDRLRMNTLRSLGQICSSLKSDTANYEHAFDCLLATLKASSKEEEGLRRKAADILSQIDDKRAIEPLLNLLQVEEDEYVRDDVIAALRSFGYEHSDELSAHKTDADGSIEIECAIDPSRGSQISEDADLFHSKPSIIWRFKAGNKFWYNSPIVYEGIVYVGCQDGKIYAVDGRTGALRWEFKTGAKTMSRYPVSDGKHLFLGSSGGHVYAVDMKTGKPVWRKKFGRSGTCCSPCLAGSRIIFGSNDGSVTSLNHKTGNVEWVSKLVRNPIPAQYFNYLASDGNIICGISLSTIYAIEATTGKLLWSKPLKTRLDSCNPVVLAYGALFHVDPVGTGTMCVARDLKTGKRIWKFAAPDYVLNTGAGVPCVANGKVYVVMDALWALDAATGKVSWSYDVKTGGFSSRPLSWPIVAGGMVFLGTTNSVAAFNTGTGERLWDIKTGGMVYSRPATSEGRIYFGCEDTFLYCLGYKK